MLQCCFATYPFIYHLIPIYRAVSNCKMHPVGVDWGTSARCHSERPKGVEESHGIAGSADMIGRSLDFARDDNEDRSSSTNRNLILNSQFSTLNSQLFLPARVSERDRLPAIIPHNKYRPMQVLHWAVLSIIRFCSLLQLIAGCHHQNSIGL